MVQFQLLYEGVKLSPSVPFSEGGVYQNLLVFCQDFYLFIFKSVNSIISVVLRTMWRVLIWTFPIFTYLVFKFI